MSLINTEKMYELEEAIFAQSVAERIRTLLQMQLENLVASHTGNNSAKVKEVRSLLRDAKKDVADAKLKIKKLRLEKKTQLPKALKGGSLSAGLLQKLFAESHNPVMVDIGDWHIDRQLSNKWVKVYYNISPASKRSIVVHRGTGGATTSERFKDVITDAKMFFGSKNDDRFKVSKDVQEKAEKKYDPKFMVVVGSSLGGTLAEDSASQDVGEIITSGKPVLPKDLITGKKTRPNQTDVRTTTDPVSMLKPLQKKNKNDITLKSKTPLDPVKSHIGSEVMSDKYFDPDTQIGIPEDEKRGGLALQSVLKKAKVADLKRFIQCERRSKRLPAKDWKVSGLKKSDLRIMAQEISDTSKK